jgi:hypothetical protein
MSEKPAQFRQNRFAGRAMFAKVHCISHSVTGRPDPNTPGRLHNECYPKLPTAPAWQLLQHLP